MSRREHNKLDKQARIRDAAWELFRERGFEATTTKAIAERAGIGTGTLFLYARSKDELLFSLFHDEIEAILAARTASSPIDTDLVDRFTYVCRGFYERYALDRALAHRFVRLVFSLDGTPRDSMRSLDRAFVTFIASAIAHEKSKGALRSDVDPVLLAKSFFAIYGVHVVEFLIRPDAKVDDAIVTLGLALRMLVDGTRP